MPRIRKTVDLRWLRQQGLGQWTCEDFVKRYGRSGRVGVHELVKAYWRAEDPCTVGCGEAWSLLDHILPEGLYLAWRQRINDIQFSGKDWRVRRARLRANDYAFARRLEKL